MPKQTSKNEYIVKSDFAELRKGMNEDFKTHIGALYEKFSGEVKLVAEQHQDTNTRVRNLEHQYQDTDTRVQRIDKKVDTLEKKMDIVVDVLGELKVDVSEIKNGLNKKADLKDQKLLEKRILALETNS
ncbi:MAG: hypothetical protein ABR875_01890 [Minisyncoccia bacterium]|jgi:peptidoglycan hydrolase CwlO-like protein